MRPWRTGLACLGVLGALAINSGCGGGDVPDPGADGQAAAIPEATAPPQPAPAPVAAAPAPKSAPADDNAEAPKTEVAAADPPAEPPATEDKPAAAPKAPAAKAAAPDRGSATAEMLALATKEPAPAAGAGTEGDAGQAGGAPGGPPGGQGGPQPGMPPRGGMGMAMGMQAQMQQQQQQQQQMQGMMRGGMGGPGMRGGQGMPGGPGMMGGPGAPGATGSSNKPPDYTEPEGAVQAFLDALKDKDLERLAEATALRAQTESSPKNQEMFKRIFDGTLSESELNALAARMDGYRIAGENPARSTGKLDVVVMKTQQANNNGSTGVMGGGARYAMRVTVRREKKGWGVCDLSAPTVFKNQSFSSPYRRKK